MFEVGVTRCRNAESLKEPVVAPVVPRAGTQFAFCKAADPPWRFLYNEQGVALTQRRSEWFTAHHLWT